MGSREDHDKEESCRAGSTSKMLTEMPPVLLCSKKIKAPSSVASTFLAELKEQHKKNRQRQLVISCSFFCNLFNFLFMDNETVEKNKAIHSDTPGATKRRNSVS